MNDKEIMENILLTTKGVVDLYMHGTVESATPNVHGAFNTALESALCMQSDIYRDMAGDATSAAAAYAEARAYYEKALATKPEKEVVDIIQAEMAAIPE